MHVRSIHGDTGLKKILIFFLLRDCFFEKMS